MTAKEPPRVDTATLDGLIEGPVPPVPEGEKLLEQWVEFVRSHEMPFQLSVDGGSFSLLPEHGPLALGGKDDLRERMQQAIEQLIQVFPDDLRGRVFSTVRSTEFRRGKRVESLFILSRGRVDVRSREVPWAGDAKSGARSLRGLPWMSIAAGSGVLLAALVVSLFFVDYRDVIRRRLSPYTRVDAERYEIDASALARYISVVETAPDERAEELEITIARAGAYPTTWSAFRDEEERLRREGDLRGYLLFQKLVVEGRLAVRYIGKDGVLLGRDERNASGLRGAETAAFRLPVKKFPDAVKIVLGD
ncbi:MAG: hypothetical protein JXA90_02825 [Planctomycetes bacterium]|nr:hypothetical protein [Planctomycetota bacterium]